MPVRRSQGLFGQIILLPCVLVWSARVHRGVFGAVHSIHGISRWGLEIKLSLYADDMLLYISDPSLINKIISVLHTFGQISGYRLNLSKSSCLPVNKLAMQIPDQALPFHISRSGFKYLGINITPSFKNL